MKGKKIETCLKDLSTDVFVWRLAFIGIFLLLLTACGCLAKKSIVYHDLTMNVARGDYPKTMAVLPFKNNTMEQNIEDLVRVSFYSHFSPRPYKDIELYKIDKAVTEKQPIDYELISDRYVKEWGKLLGCDAVIFGEVTHFQRLFLGIYSQIKLSCRIMIWDTKTGKKIWDDEHVVRSHEGGVPFHFAEIPLIAIKSGLNLLEKEKVRAADELCRYLAGRIPAPVDMGSDNSKEPRYIFELQAGAFLDEKRADNLLEGLRAKGYPTYIQRREKQDGLWNRVLLGPYEDQKEAIETKDRIQKDLGLESFIVRKPQEDKRD